MYQRISLLCSLLFVVMIMLAQPPGLDQSEMYQPPSDEIERFKMIQEQYQMDQQQQQQKQQLVEALQQQFQQHQAQQQAQQQAQAQQQQTAAAALVPLLLAASGNGHNPAGSEMVQLHPAHHQQHLQQIFQQQQQQQQPMQPQVIGQPVPPVGPVRSSQPEQQIPVGHHNHHLANPGFDLLMLSQAAGITNIQAAEEQKQQLLQQQQTGQSNKKQDLNYGQHYAGEHHVSENQNVNDIVPNDQREYEEDKLGDFHPRGSNQPPYRCYACQWSIQHCADFNCYNNPDTCTNNHFSPRRIQRADCPTGCEQFVVTDPNGLVQQWQRGCAPINHIPVKGYQCRTHYQFGIRFDRCLCNRDWCNSVPPPSSQLAPRFWIVLLSALVIHQLSSRHLISTS